MEARGAILEKLNLSAANSVAVGIFIQGEASRFVIGFVDRIETNPDEVADKVYLREHDILGATIAGNPLTLDSIAAVRVYKQLKGSGPF